MGITTNIEWCDSSLNLMAGCDGCELWNPKTGVKHCYAGTLTERYGGKNPGFPESFDKPKLFLRRLEEGLRWPDLTGKERPKKPWLSGLPRLVFLNDMGDTFTESLPLDWLAPLLPRMAESPHVWMLLTKRAMRMLEFSRQHPFPPNVWPGVSITTAATLTRLSSLAKVRGGGWKWVSAEPLLEAIDMSGHLLYEERDIIEGGSGPVLGMTRPFGLVIVGGESGPGARPMHPDWARSLRDQCRAAGVPFFFKQWGEWLHTPEGFQGNGGIFLKANGETCLGDEPSVTMTRVGKKAAGRLLDGRKHSEFPR